MKKIKTKISGLFIIENISFSDQRGEFMELWNYEKFQQHDFSSNFSQDNISISKKNVIRGLHFQNKPYEQIKYVNVIQGKVLDIVVDIRKKSKTFGEHFSIELTNNQCGLWIPSGMAHGFLSLEDNTIFSYKCIGEYQPKHEYIIKWNDQTLDIKWGISNPIVSEKDKKGISLKDYLKSNKIHA